MLAAPRRRSLLTCTLICDPSAIGQCSKAPTHHHSLIMMLHVAIIQRVGSVHQCLRNIKLQEAGRDWTIPGCKLFSLGSQGFQSEERSSPAQVCCLLIHAHIPSLLAKQSQLIPSSAIFMLVPMTKMASPQQKG